MLINGQWVDNVTCPRCKQRHPAITSCAEAQQLAEVYAREREEQSAAAARRVHTTHQVPDQCEGIVWRGQYYALPLL